jgi:hypothetical protein
MIPTPKSVSCNYAMHVWWLAVDLACCSIHCLVSCCNCESCGCVTQSAADTRPRGAGWYTTPLQYQAFPMFHTFTAHIHCDFHSGLPANAFLMKDEHILVNKLYTWQLQKGNANLTWKLWELELESTSAQLWKSFGDPWYIFKENV